MDIKWDVAKGSADVRSLVRVWTVALAIGFTCCIKLLWFCVVYLFEVD